VRRPAIVRPWRRMAADARGARAPEEDDGEAHDVQVADAALDVPALTRLAGRAASAAVVATPASSARCSRSGSVSSHDGGRASRSGAACEAHMPDGGGSSAEISANMPPATSDLASVPLAFRVPGSPGRDVWMTEPPSIDEPLLLLDEESGDDRLVARLREELAEARAMVKRDRAALEDVVATLEEAERERDDFRRELQRLDDENRVLRLQLEDHHGIMAADWAQTLGFQERLRQEEMARERLAEEAAELRETAKAQAAEAAALRSDAELWQRFTQPRSWIEASSAELDGLLDAAAPALARLQREVQQRSRLARMQLHNELEQQLCVVCRDAKKTVLFLPCSHICVCEPCRGRLRPYRCPMCQEPVQSFVGRVHF